MKGHHKAQIEELKLESADLAAMVEDLQETKAWLLSEGARLLAKNIHKGSEMTVAVAAVNNAMSAIGVNSVPLLNRNAEVELNTTIACFDSLTFPVVNDLPKLINEPLSNIKDALFFAVGESSKERGGHTRFLGVCTFVDFSWLNFWKVDVSGHLGYAPCLVRNSVMILVFYRLYI
ncbi:hypothetical protein Hanom_Chr01g00058071 [Helianthus anomalus]